MASLTTMYLLLLATIFLTSQLSLSLIIIEIKFLNYTDNCREDINKNRCDPKFKFCLDRPRSPPTINRCHYGYTAESGHYQDTNYVNFDSVKNIKGINNPWYISTAQLMDPSVLLVFQVRDDDLWGDDDHLQTWGIIVTQNVYPSREDAPYTTKISTSNSHTMSFKMRMYCETGKYNPACTNYCKASDNPSGHYTCDLDTGAKICMQGWTGSNCNEDINECLLNYCGKGNCENLQADYTCHCPPYYTGKNCTIMESHCDRNPCSNNATCTNLPDFDYNCTCIGEWEGKNCSTKLNPCKAEPCQNRANCLPSVDYTSYSCVCVYPYTGIHCDTISPATSSATKSPTSSAPKSPATTLSTSTNKLTTLSSENINGVAAGRTNTKEALNSTENPGIQNWHFILIAILAIAFIVVIIVCLVVRQRRRKHKLSTNGSVVYDNNNKLAFENNLYNDVGRDPEVMNERQREHPPLPSTPTENAPLKPVFTPSNMDVQGAEGGVNRELEIDMDIDGYVKPNSCKNIKTEKSSLSEQTQNNYYTDFNRLKGNPEKCDSADDCHFYHDLDEIALAVKGLNNASKEKEFASVTAAAPKVDEDCGQVKNYASPITEEETAYNDTPSNIPAEFSDYGNVHKTFSDEIPDDSFVFVTTAPENFYSEPANPRNVGEPEPVLHPLALERGLRLNDEVKLDVPQTSDPSVSEGSSDEGLEQVSISQDGDYCTPRGLLVDSTALKETPECQYDIPPNNHLSKILTGSYNAGPKSLKVTKSVPVMLIPPVRSTINTGQNGNENLKNNRHNREDGLSSLPPEVPTRSYADQPVINNITNSNGESFPLPISIIEKCTFQGNDEISNSKEGEASIQEGHQSNLSSNIYFDNYGSSNT